MDTKLYTLITFFLIGYIKTQNQCAIYSCNKLETGVCSVQTIKDANPANFTLQRCPSDSFCPFNPVDASDQCNKVPATKFYPGSACVTSDDCNFGLSLPCVNNTCSGSGVNEKCETHNNCKIGLACLVNGTAVDKICQPQKIPNDNCTSDFECTNNLGCFNNTCRHYFSLADGTEVLDAKMCKSGYLLNGKCLTMTNVKALNTTCDTDENCQYEDTNKTLVGIISTSCQCGLNREGKKYCAVGSGNQPYVDYVNNYRNLLNDTSLCHTMERSGSCAERTRRDRSVNYRRSLQNFGNSHVNAFNAHKLILSDTCVKYVAFSEYNDNPVRPESYQCAKFTCDSKGSSCLSSMNPFADGGVGVLVNLTKSICLSNETCIAGPTGMEEVYNNEAVKGRCVSTTPPVPTVTRFPGESCSKEADCYSTGDYNLTCANSTCTGVKENGNCTLNGVCMLGLYCNGTSCIKQRDLNDKCDSTSNCANNLACYNKTCVEFGSVKTGGDMSQAVLGLFYQSPFKSLLCEYGHVTKNDTCGQIDYNSQFANKTNKDGYVTCNKDEKCSYTDGTQDVVQPCGCGYNADGQGFCPIPHTRNSDYWRSAVKSQAKAFKNKCHSMNRYDCYLPYETSLLNEIANNKHKTSQAHLYYKAVDCASDVLAGSILKYSVYALLAFLVFVF